jgi:hypothetical protein|mmetsp:Transcript_34842/g.58201  ORF Transcript_34842/g.58201 Transcript_34842/m.58201 type:complete len:128 (+) Transcript_34842:1742-2125(+)
MLLNNLERAWWSNSLHLAAAFGVAAVKELLSATKNSGFPCSRSDVMHAFYQLSRNWTPHPVQCMCKCARGFAFFFCFEFSTTSVSLVKQGTQQQGMLKMLIMLSFSVVSAGCYGPFCHGREMVTGQL